MLWVIRVNFVLTNAFQDKPLYVYNLYEYVRIGINDNLLIKPILLFTIRVVRRKHFLS